MPPTGMPVAIVKAQPFVRAMQRLHHPDPPASSGAVLGHEHQRFIAARQSEGLFEFRAFCERVGKQRCSPSFCVGTLLGAPDFKQAKGTWSGRVALARTLKDEEEIIMTRVAKLLAVATIPALLIAASGPLLAHGSGGGGG